MQKYANHQFPHNNNNHNNDHHQHNLIRGGATVLKVGGTILRAERAKKFFDPHFLASGGTKYCLVSLIPLFDL